MAEQPASVAPKAGEAANPAKSKYVFVLTNWSGMNAHSKGPVREMVPNRQKGTQKWATVSIRYGVNRFEREDWEYMRALPHVAEWIEASQLVLVVDGDQILKDFVGNSRGFAGASISFQDVVKRTYNLEYLKVWRTFGATLASKKSNDDEFQSLQRIIEEQISGLEKGDIKLPAPTVVMPISNSYSPL